MAEKSILEQFFETLDETEKELIKGYIRNPEAETLSDNFDELSK